MSIWNVLIATLLPLALRADNMVHCTDDGPFYFKFLPKSVGMLELGSPLKISGLCFKTIEFELKETPEAFEVVAMARDKRSWLCSDIFIINHIRSPGAHLAFMSGSYRTAWPKAGMPEAEMQYIRSKGLKVLMSCAELKDWPKSLWMSIKTILGGLGNNPHIPIFGSKNPEYQIEANREWVKGWTGHEYSRRADKLVHVDKREIKSGTFIGIYRFDGLDNMINVASGSRLGHTTIAVWHEDELYVLESQDAWYWPTRSIQKTKWETWVRQAHDADFSVILLPLDDEHQALFDEQKAWDWFNHVAGLDYGFHNFVFGYTDTLNANWPEFIDIDFVMWGARLYEQIKPDDIRNVLTNAFNMRLGTNASILDEIIDELINRGMTYQELFAIVEKEGWQYPNGVNYVCSAFVTSVYRRAGLFGDLDINSTEFTPKDVYELNFFDTTGSKVPKGCKDFAPFGYCQIMGKIQLDLGEMNYVEPYAHMNEKCPTVAPEFKHIEGC